MDEAPSNAGHRQRLRNRFRRTGLIGLADHEALELLLCFGIPRKDVKPLAKQLLQRYGSLAAVIDAPPDELEEFPGIGESAAVLPMLVKSLCARYLEQNLRPLDLMEHSSAVAQFVRMKIGGGPKERFMAMYLSIRNQLLAYEITDGTVDRTAIYHREIAESALRHRASAVIVAHNHPSGFLEPSNEDLLLSFRIRDALKVLGIALHDHLIVSGAGFFSLRDEKFL